MPASKALCREIQFLTQQLDNPCNVGLSHLAKPNERRQSSRQFQAPRHQARIAFCACRRFSASSQTTDWGPSMTAAATSRPR